MKSRQNLQYVEAYTEYLLQERHTSINTARSYRYDLIKLCRYAEETGVDRPESMDSLFFEKYAGRLLESGNSAGSISRQYSAVRGFFRFLKKYHIVPSDPSEYMPQVKIKEKKEEILLSEEELSLLRRAPLEGKGAGTLQGYRDAAILELLYAAGVRTGELVRLRIDDLDMQIGYAVLTDEAGGQRKVPLGKAAKKALQEYLFCRKEDFFREEILFCGRNGGPLSRQSVWKILKKYTAQAGIGKRVTSGMLRRTLAYSLLQQGADEESIGYILGVQGSVRVLAGVKESSPEQNRRVLYEKAVSLKPQA